MAGELVAPGNGVSRASLWLSIATSVAMLFGATGSIFYIGFKVQATSDALDIQLRRVSVLEDRISILQDRMTKIEVAQNEIETQFCGEDIVRNLMHANDKRTESLLWEKVFGTKIPTDNAYYPTICNRNSKQ